jgi:hypothetical protein
MNERLEKRVGGWTNIRVATESQDGKVVRAHIIGDHWAVHKRVDNPRSTGGRRWWVVTHRYTGVKMMGWFQTIMDAYGYLNFLRKAIAKGAVDVRTSDPFELKLRLMPLAQEIGAIRDQFACSTDPGPRFETSIVDKTQPQA